jgi:hypothetical protein
MAMDWAVSVSVILAKVTFCPLIAIVDTVVLEDVASTMMYE